jgi:hypothetical protein
MRMHRFEPRVADEIPLAGVTLRELMSEKVTPTLARSELSWDVGDLLCNDDEVWRFRTPPWTWDDMSGVEGFVVLRCGLAVHLLTTMTDDEKRVAQIVRAAFVGVALGDGIGLRQANGIDDYADAETLIALRSQDETENWEAIPFEVLDRHYCSLAYFDAAGMRFHLPAYLMADLAGALYTADIVYHLIYGGYGPESPFGTLSDVQRNAVREFLELRYFTREFDAEVIEARLRDYWK